ncbi:MAG: TPM domain-containing protein [Bacteroidetes Order II. Incertae sedis bacterium]|nr:TPM domain-containing protein [Bacteroidetes Order II. bacterium]
MALFNRLVLILAKKYGPLKLNGFKMMGKIFLVITCWFCLLGLGDLTAAQDLPNPKKWGPNAYVSNPNNLLTIAEVAHLNRLLMNMEHETKAQMAVVVVKELKGKSAKMLATELLNRWGVGQRGINNGILLLVAVENREWAFEIGYGLEPVLTDYVTAQLGGSILVPHFKKAAYAMGISNVVKEIHTLLLQPSRARELHQKAENEATADWWENVWFVLVLLLFLLGLYLLISSPYKRLPFAAAVGLLTLSGGDVLVLVVKWLGVQLPLVNRIGIGIYTGVGFALLADCIRKGKEAAIPYKFHPALALVLAEENRYCKLKKIIFPLTLLVYAWWKQWYIRHQQNQWSEKTRKSQAKKPFAGVRRLSASEKTNKLNAGEHMEEALKTCRHDVWVDQNGKVVEKVAYNLRLFGYLTCEKCKYLTMIGGYEDESPRRYLYRCQFCGHSYEEKNRSSATGLSNAPSSQIYEPNDRPTTVHTPIRDTSSGQSEWGGGASGGAGASGTW